MYTSELCSYKNNQVILHVKVTTENQYTEPLIVS